MESSQIYIFIMMVVEKIELREKNILNKQYVTRQGYAFYPFFILAV